MADVDELFEIKNSYYIGNYQHCINECQKIKPTSPELQLERDVFLYRALIGQRKYGVVQNEIKSNAAPPLQAVKLLAKYFATPVSSRTSVVGELEAILGGNLDASESTLFIVAATIYCHEEDYEGALRILNQSDSLECRSLMVQAYLHMDRLDFAKKELKSLQEKDDDATLTQLAQAWTHVASGGEKLQDAYYIYQELIDKNVSTPMLLNGQAVCFIGQAKYEEAESALMEALEKDSNSPEAILNMMVLSHHLNKSAEISNRYLAQLKTEHKDQKIVRDFLAKEEEFDRVANLFSIPA